MNKILSIIIGLALLSAAPLSVLGQNSEPEPSEPIGVDPGEPTPAEPLPYWYYMPEPGGFEYTDGVANGTYVDFNLDEATGTITDYTSTLIDYNYYYPMMYYENNRTGGNDYGYYPPDYNPEPTEYVVKFFESIVFDSFVPNGHPMVLGQSLVYLGENVMATLTDYDYSSISLMFGEVNGTVTFTVPNGVEISEYPPYYELYGGDISADYYGMGDAGYYYDYYQWDEAYLKIGNVTGSIWVDQGSLEIVGNQIIIQTHAGTSVYTSAYIEYGYTYEYSEAWFGDFSTDDQGALEGAFAIGLVAAVGYLVMNNGVAEYDDAKTMNDPSFQLEFMNMEQNRFQVQVDSDIETGRIVTLNVNKEALNAQNMNEISVLLDSEDVSACGSMEELVDLQGGTEPGFYMISGTNQNTIFVYVPHFSTHIITVGLEESQIVNVVLPGAIAIAFIAVAVGLVLLRGKRGKDEM